MLQLFRRNLFTNVIALFLMTMVLFCYGFFAWGNVEIQAFNLPFYETTGINIPLANNLFFQYIIVIALVFSQSLMLSGFIIKHKMSRQLSLIPGATMTLYCAICLHSGMAHIILLANLFFVFSLGSLFQIYKEFKPIGRLFNSGFFLGIAALLYLPYCIYIIAILFGLLALRGLKIKEIIQVTLGFLCPFFFMGVLMYYNDGLSVYFEHFSLSIGIPQIPYEPIHDLLKPGLILIIILYLIFKQNTLRKKKKFDAIKKIELNFWILLLGFISTFFIHKLSSTHLLFVSVPISILGGLILENKENSIINEFSFILILGFYIAIAFNIF